MDKVGLQRNHTLNATRNTAVGASSLKQKEVKQTAGEEQQLNLFEDQGVTMQPQAEAGPQREGGAVHQEVAPGKFDSVSDSGLKLRYDANDHSFNLKMPGYQLAGDGDGNIVGKGPDGKALHDPQRYETKDGEMKLKFKDNKGSEFDVSLDTLDFTATDRTGSVKQHVYAEGEQVVNIESRLEVGGGKKAQVNNLVAEFLPDGQQAMDEGVSFGKGQVSFPLPNGVETTRTLPFPLPEKAAAPAAPPQVETKPKPIQPDDVQPVPPQAVTPDQVDLTGVNPSATPLPPPNGQPILAEDPPGATQSEEIQSASGLTRTSVSGMTASTLPNGAQVIEKPDGSVSAFDSNGQQVKVEVKDFTNTNGQADKRYTFEDGNNLFSVFKNSFDVVGESKDGSRAQIAHPDGRIFSAVRDDQGVHTSTIHPDGRVTSSGGVKQNAEAPGVMNVGGKDVAMPFSNWTKLDSADDGLVASGFVPGAFPSAQEAKHNEAATQAPRPGASYEPQPGQPQAGFTPSLWSRIKSVFTGENPGWGSAPDAGGGPHPGYQQGPHPGYQQRGPHPGYRPGPPGYDPGMDYGMDPNAGWYHPGGPPPPGMGRWGGGHDMHDMVMEQQRQTNSMMKWMMAGSVISSIAFPLMMFASPMTSALMFC